MYKDLNLNEFMQLIKLLSCWKIDKRKGNYKLPSGCMLDAYLLQLIKEFLNTSCKGIDSNYTLRDLVNDYTLFIPFGENEITNKIEQDKRIIGIINDLLY